MGVPRTIVRRRLVMFAISAVAVIALVAGRHWAHYRDRYRYHALRTMVCIVRHDITREQIRAISVWTCHHRQLASKYRRAMYRPWEHFPPDPPEPPEPNF